MKQRAKTGNARNRVKAGAGDLSKGLLRRLRQLEQANQDLTVQLANALERIGALEMVQPYYWLGDTVGDTAIFKGSGAKLRFDVAGPLHEAADARSADDVWADYERYAYEAFRRANEAVRKIDELEVERLTAAAMSAVNLSASLPKRSFWRRVFSAESGGKLLTIARAVVLLALFLVLLGLGFSIGHAAAAVLRGGG